MTTQKQKDEYIQLALSIINKACSEVDNCTKCVIFHEFDMKCVEDCPLNTLEVPANWDLDTLYEQAFDRAEPDLAELVRKGDIYDYV